MNFKVISVYNEGDPEMEHVLLRAGAACSIGTYLLANGGAGEDSEDTDRDRQSYWFPNTELKAGEFVSLWTKSGKNAVGEMDDGTPIYRFYWNLAKPVWSDSGINVLLFDLRICQRFRVHKT